MSIAIDGFSSFAKVARDLENVTDKTQISLCQIDGKEVSIGRLDRGQTVRSELLKSLNNTFGEGGIPESVLKAMNVDKALSGFRVKNGVIQATNHPLTARRLRAIIGAVQVELAKAERSRLMQELASMTADDVNDLNSESLRLGIKLNLSDLNRVVTGIKNYKAAEDAGKIDEGTKGRINAMTKRQQALFKGVFEDIFRFKTKSEISEAVKQYAEMTRQIEGFFFARNSLPTFDDLPSIGIYEPSGKLPW